MEARMRKYGVQASPDRARQAQKQVSRKLPVVYYLCRNRHLEHPHFIEVPISSHDCLYLRDFIKRLIELRGKGMPSMYSWSSKRSYKNGFVWHDLSEDDLILPVHGNEYVLKGSELLDQSPPDRSHIATIAPKPPHLNAPSVETPTSSKTQEASSSSFPVTVIKESKASLPPPNQEEEQSPRRPPSCDSGSSEFMVYKPTVAADASTQTDDARKKKACEKVHTTCTRGVSTDDCPVDVEFEEGRQMCANGDEISPPPTSSEASSSGGKMETLENLIREDARKMKSFRVLDEEEAYVPAGPKLRATNVLMQLITCGSLSVKDHNTFGLVPTYKPRFSQMNFTSPMFAGSMTWGELDCLSENPRMMRLKMEDKEYFSGSLVETKKHKEEIGEGVATLKRSSSYNADRGYKSPDFKNEKVLDTSRSKCLQNEKVLDTSRSKCLPRAIKVPTPSKQFRNSVIRSPVSDCPRISSAGPDSGQLSLGGSKRITDNSSVKGSSMRLESFKEDKEKVIKIEERLTSGARVIIQSRAPCDESEGSSSS